jgi:voltage-gated potassium channel
MNDKNPIEKQELDNQRYQVLQQIEDWLEVPVIFLGFVWLILIVVDLLWGLSPFLNAIFYFIWIIFIIEFLIRFILAPHKVIFLRSNWLTALSLPIPALRIFAVFRLVRVLTIARAARGLEMVRIVASVNRGMRALRDTMVRRGFAYALVLTILVVITGSAGMLAFERGYVENGGINTYGDALWFTSMVMTTIGADSWPQTPEGRLLAFLLSLYALAVFSYITASLASFFVGQEATHEDSPVAGTDSINALREEIRALREELHNFNDR